MFLQGAVTHSARLSVKTLNFEWEPPMSLSGNISFFATVVKDKATFWVKLQSPELYKRVSAIYEISEQKFGGNGARPCYWVCRNAILPCI